MPDNSGNQKKDWWTKVMFGFLVFFGISSLILGMLQISRNINIGGSYTGAEEDQINLESLAAKLETEQRTVEEMQSTDTDGDGLNDFEEMYVYKTSMYLTDSDSDGYPDKEEIDGGYDPNCPKGQECRGTSQETINNKQETSNVDYNLDNQGENYLPTEMVDELKNLTPAEVRQLLLESGQVTEEQLDAIDDETLMQVFLETLNQ